MNTGSRVMRSIRAIALLFAVLPQAGCAESYSANALEAWVVDEATGKPVEGVVVVAHWQAETGNFGGRVPAGQVMIMESVTDPNGRFYFPAWGPKAVSKGIVEEKRPRLILFKKGYEYRELVSSSIDKPWGTQMRSSWHGKKVGLKSFQGSLAAYAEHLGFMKTALEAPAEKSEGTCGWRSFPKMLRTLDALDQEFSRERLTQLSIVASLRASEEFQLSKGCGSITEVLKGEAK